MFELVHGKNTHSAALPTSITYYLRELRRVIDVAVEQHADDPQWLSNLTPDSPEFAEWLKVVETWVPLSTAADLAITKSELVKVFMSSKPLSLLLIEVCSCTRVIPALLLDPLPDRLLLFFRCRCIRLGTRRSVRTQR